MLALYFVGTVLLSMLVTVGGTLLLIPWLPDDSLGVVITATLGCTLIVIGAIFAGAFVQWQPEDISKRRRQLRRMIVVSGAVQLVGAIAFVATAILVGAPPWIPVAVLAAGAALTAFSYATGRALARRTVPMSDADVDAAGLDGGLLRRTIRTMTIVAGTVAAVVSATFVAVLGAIAGVDVERVVTGLVVGVGFGCFVASFVGIGASFKIIGALRSVTGGDYGQARRIAQVVLRRKQHALDEEERSRAVRYARVMRLYLPLQAAQNAALFVGIISTQLMTAIGGDGFFRVFALGIVAFLVLGIVVLVPIGLRQYRRVSEYVEEHSGVSAREP